MPRVRPRLRDEVAFLLTNRVPRHAASRLMRWYSRVESRRLARLSIAVWRRFAPELRLDEAESRDFASVHACFTRRLRAGARPIDPTPDVATSPCDGIVGAHGRIDDDTLVQAKGLTYTLADLLGDAALAERHRGGAFVTLRLTPSMYHRFHAPCDGRLPTVRFVAGDRWNVNPVTVRRVERLFCRNARAVLDLELRDAGLRSAGHALTLVPIAAILVAGIVVHAAHGGPASFAKGDELGFFEHGSTIVVLASRGFTLAESVAEGRRVRAGEPLLRLDGACLSAPTSERPQ